MRTDHRRELFPCPDCGVDSGEFCISKKGEEMSRFVHPNRGRNETSIDNLLKLRQWLMDYRDIFRLPHD